MSNARPATTQRRAPYSSNPPTACPNVGSFRVGDRDPVEAVSFAVVDSPGNAAIVKSDSVGARSDAYGLLVASPRIAGAQDERQLWRAEAGMSVASCPVRRRGRSTCRFSQQVAQVVSAKRLIVFQLLYEYAGRPPPPPHFGGRRTCHHPESSVDCRRSRRRTTCRPDREGSPGRTLRDMSKRIDGESAKRC